MKKVVLITGCSSGLGVLLCEKFDQPGYKVYGSVRSQDDKKELLTRWKDRGISLVILDVNSEDDCRRVIDQIKKESGGVDILVNNAGYTTIGSMETLTTEDLSNILDTNTIGPFRLIKLVLEDMKKKRSGQIINVTSLSGLIVFPGFGLYSASKFALEALGKALHYELKKYNIRVTQVEPGAIKLSDSKITKKIEHLPVREKYWLIKTLLPMIKREIVAEKIVKLTLDSNPPSNLILGRDAKLTTLAHKILPSFIWNKIVEKFCL